MCVNGHMLWVKWVGFKLNELASPSIQRHGLAEVKGLTFVPLQISHTLGTIHQIGMITLAAHAFPNGDFFNGLHQYVSFT